MQETTDKPDHGEKQELTELNTNSANEGTRCRRRFGRRGSGERNQEADSGRKHNKTHSEMMLNWNLLVNNRPEQQHNTQHVTYVQLINRLGVSEKVKRCRCEFTIRDVTDGVGV